MKAILYYIRMRNSESLSDRFVLSKHISDYAGMINRIIFLFVSISFVNAIDVYRYVRPGLLGDIIFYSLYAFKFVLFIPLLALMFSFGMLTSKIMGEILNLHDETDGKLMRFAKMLIAGIGHLLAISIILVSFISVIFLMYINVHADAKDFTFWDFIPK